ncbi:dihydrofolate reductase family protein [Actinospica durhamensis]|uniref:Dihydrofolate reductase family protein n=1 Tax=Actinospica durhamensis TaxID=1508375 RepID=A0A941IVR0_9ACTN|nr:dihydrofolate reductase family protein [Actinospica durhamensis]MBR7837626.1 dihydrofolate reductase family protein [Actinospica durhamensis]
MRQLLPEPPRGAHEPDLSEIYAYPGRARRWLRANMVASADGAAQADGASRGLSGAADVRVLRTLRALADVVLVGATTVRTEGYLRPVVARPEFAEARAAAGQPPTAAIAVVSASLEVDFGTPLYTEALTPTITVTTADAPRDRLAQAEAAGEVLIAGEGGRVDLTGAVDLLADSGRGRLLCEGGPKLLGAMALAGRLDELCLSVSPQLRSGAGLRILDGPELAAPLGLTLHTLLTEDGFLFARYLVV